MRVKDALFSLANDESKSPHSCGCTDARLRRVSGRFFSMFLQIAPLGPRAGDDEWSVAVTEAAFASKLIMDGRAVPVGCRDISSFENEEEKR